LNAPVWSLDPTKLIDPNVLINDFIWIQEAPYLVSNGTTLYALYPAQADDGQNFERLQLCQTSNLGSPQDGWTAVTAFSLQTDAPPGFNFGPTQGMFGATLFSPAVIPPTPPLAPTQAITGGIPFAVPGCRKRNQFDWCMFEESLRIRNIKFPPFCSIPKEYLSCFPLPWDEDFGANAIPPGAVPFNEPGSILTPTTASGDNVLVSARVPQGYDGLMQGVYWAYLGQFFEQGSGDIVWRVKLNQRYVENLGNVPFALGSNISPMPLTQGQILLSGQQYQLIVKVPNLSGMIQIGAARIIGGMLGFYWPRG
jgi:hypothetical protein